MLLQILLLAVGSVLLLGAFCVAVLGFDYIRYTHGSYIIAPGPVAGFAAKFSYVRGEPIALYIHTKTPATLTIQRLSTGWTPVGAAIPVPSHVQPRRFSRHRGLSWTSTLTIESADLEPGLYRLLLQQNGGENARFSIPIIIKGEPVHPLCVVLSTNTWEAYNTFGGISHYENHHVSALSKTIAKLLRLSNPRWAPEFVPASRPNLLFSVEVELSEFGVDYSSFTIRNELEFLVFLAKSGMPFSVYCDDDLAMEPALQEAKALIFAGHSEYWTDAMIYTLERYVLKSGKIYFSSFGLEGHCAITPLGRKFKWRLTDEVSDTLTGTHGTGEGDFTAAPYRILQADHWVFAGTGRKAGDLFGEACANHPSLDAVGHQHLKGEIDLAGQPQQGASGFFTARTGFGSGAFTILAAGTNPLGPAHMVYRDLPGGGWIFNASSHCFNGSLCRDEVAQKIVNNLMASALSHRAPPDAR
jgi:N,N-dimethylformamidase beta subunit-like, C-terminal